jgi:hypothetical protein
MGMDVYMPKPTISIAVFRQVPSGVIGDNSDRWAHRRRPSMENAMRRGTWGSHVAIEEVVQLGQLQIDGGDGGVHRRSLLGEGLVEAGGCLLQVGDACVPEMLGGGHLIEALDDGCLLGHEAVLHLGVEFRHLLEHQLDVGIHGSKLSFLAVRVMDWFQGVVGSRLVIPLVTNWKELEKKSTSRGSEEEECL